MSRFHTSFFKRQTRLLPYMLTTFLITSLSACGGSSSDDDATQSANMNPSSTPDNMQEQPLEQAETPPSSTPPGVPASSQSSFIVSEATPIDGADTRSLASQINIKFNKPIIAATATKERFSLLNGNNNVDFELSENNQTDFTLTPSTMLAPNTTYTVTLSDELMSEDGENLEVTSWRFTTAGNLGSTSQEVIDNCMSDTDRAMLAAVNDVRATGYRCASGVKPSATAMKWSCVIGSAALRHSTDMATNNFHQHTGSDGSSHAQRMIESGFPRNRASAENIAAGYRSVDAAMQGWLTSETGHCKNIMNETYTDFGSSLVIAPERTTTYGYYWTQNFGRP